MPRSRRSDRFCKTSRRPTLCWYDASAHAWHVSPKGKCGSSASEIEFCKPKRRKLERAHLGQIF
jgi:hypothetical protein